MLGVLRYVHDALQVCTLWFPRTVKPRIASQLLIGNQFPSAFQCASPESDWGLENWCQKPMAQDRQETEQFLFNKENTPETGWDEGEEGRAFPRLYRGKEGTLGVNRAAFCLLPPWFLQILLRHEHKWQTTELKALCRFCCPHISVSITIIPWKSGLTPFQQYI